MRKCISCFVFCFALKGTCVCQRWASGIFLNHPPLCFFRQVLTLSMELTSSIQRTSQAASGTKDLPVSASSVLKWLMLSAQASFDVNSGESELRLSCLCGQCFYHLSHLLRPKRYHLCCGTPLMSFYGMHWFPKTMSPEGGSICWGPCGKSYNPTWIKHEIEAWRVTSKLLILQGSHRYSTVLASGHFCPILPSAIWRMSVTLQAFLTCRRRLIILVS